MKRSEKKAKKTNTAKKTAKKLLTALTLLCIGGILPAGRAQAASAGENTGYSYTVSIYAGNQGTFQYNLRLSVDHTKSGNTSPAQVRVRKGKVTVKGLQKDDIITLDLRSNSIELDESSRYYVKGIRQSGRDNSTVATSVFRVDRDADYVVAYGVQGDMVAYTVNYQDAQGNELLPSETFYGNVGDKPVVAYQYREGYEPESLALTKTLSSNEAENVFTFVYRPAERETVTRQVGTPGTTTITDTVTEILPAPAPAAVPGEGAAAPGEAGAAAEEGTGEEAPAGEEDTGGEAEEEPGTQEIGDQEVPLANQDLQDLDDEEVPAGDIQLDKVVKKGLPLAASIGIAAAAAAGLIVLAVLLKKRRGRKAAAATGREDHPQ